MNITMFLLIPLLLLLLLGGAAVLMAVMITQFVRARNSGEEGGAWISSPRVLGIVGGVVALVVVSALSYYALVAVMVRMDAGIVLAGFCLLGVAGGAAGIIGGIMVPKHRRAAGILMLAGGAASLITIFGPMLLITGGVLALVPEKKAEMPDCPEPGV